MKKVKMFIRCVIVLCIVSLISGCGCSIIPPGHVGIKVNNVGSERGVQNYTAQTGLVLYMPGVSTIFEYPTFVQTAVWSQSEDEGSPINEEISFNTKEGSPVSGDVSLSYQLLPEKVPSFYVKFRSDNLEEFTHGFMRNVARDGFNEIGARYTLEEIYGIKKEELLNEVKKRINLEVNQYGVSLVQFGFTGRLRIEQNIMNALNNKIKTTQDAIAAENRLREATANAANRVAAAKGEAEANIVLAQSITDNLIKWRQMDLTEAAIKRWNGVRPMVEGNDSGLLLQLPLPKK